MKIDEVSCYESLAADQNVHAGLVVASASAEWCAGNNVFLAQTVSNHAWVRPTAYFDLAQPPDVEQLEQRRRQSFVGVSCYIFGPDHTGPLAVMSNEVWSWLCEYRWLVSVNSQGSDLSFWVPILDKFPALHMVISHLGLPPALEQPPSDSEARQALFEVLALSVYPGARVKLSGFYALSEPDHDYPYEAAWPYVKVLAEDFGTDRLLRASDFSPCLDTLTFSRTYGLFAKMPFLSNEDRKKIEGANLLGLLD